MPRILVLLLASAVLAGASVSPASAAWSGVADLAPANAANHPVGAPSLAVAPDGTAFAGFQRYDGANLRAAVAMRVPSGGFGAVRDLSPAGKDAFSPAVAVDRQGNATLAWLQGPDFTIQARFRPIGGDWTEPTTLSGTGVSRPRRSPWATTAPRSWSGDGTPAATSGASSRDRAAGDAAFERRCPPRLMRASACARARAWRWTPRATVAAIWTRRTTMGGAYRVETAVKAVGAAVFQPSETRSAQTGDAGCNTDIRMTPGGRVTAIWDHRDAADAKFYVAVADRSAPFTTPWSGQAKISTLTVDSTEPVVALDDAGNAGATWLASGQIVLAFRAAARSRPRPSRCPARRR
jgi:hypothetical protein